MSKTRSPSKPSSCTTSPWSTSRPGASAVSRPCCGGAIRSGAWSVNLSPLQLKDGGIVRTVRSALASAGLPAARLDLEITGTALLVDGEATLSSLHALRRLGVRIALDDFGTGYSSLSDLRRFPFDEIKIDRSCVRDRGENGECAAIVQAVAALGRALRMTVTAEGVETRHQHDLVRHRGCDEIQGYLYSPAVPIDRAADMLRFGIEPQAGPETRACQAPRRGHRHPPVSRCR